MNKHLRRRVGIGLVLLAGALLVLVVMPQWRKYQLRTSCENGGQGQWNAQTQTCTFGLPASSPDTRNTPQPAPEPK